MKPSKLKRFFKSCLCAGGDSSAKEPVEPAKRAWSHLTMSIHSSPPNGAAKNSIRDMRQPYMARGESFTEAHLVSREPFAQFEDWFQQACQSKAIVEPNAMCLATATKDGKPSNRMVLLKDYSQAGFKFFTNYNSRKGQEIAENPNVAINFFWEPLKKCVRIEGRAQKLSSQESTEYFHSRPIGSQVGSALSPQSRPIKDRNYLIEKENEMLAKYSDQNPVPRPDSWGGYLIIPTVFEFWQGHVNRMHDRIVFRRPRSGEVPDEKLLHQGDNGWVMERLAP